MAYAQGIKGATFMYAGAGFQGPGYHYKARPSLAVAAHVGVHKDLALGLVSSYYQYRILGTSRYSFFVAGMRTSYYFNTLLKRHNKKTHYYAGLGISYFSFRYSDFPGRQGQLFVPVHIGVKRIFGKFFGGFIELGLNDAGLLKLGLVALIPRQADNK